MMSSDTEVLRVVCPDEGSTVGLGAHVLSLAAAPTFAVMAGLTFFGVAPHELSCCTASHMAMPTGMSLMYLLMGVFHSSAWLKFFSIQRMRASTAARSQADSGERDISRVDTPP